ncbi:MAG: CoA transferase [Acidimicrobiia bacterium]|nr:CoA transferase [Acidimicrobiia bacterium]
MRGRRAKTSLGSISAVGAGSNSRRGTSSSIRRCWPIGTRGAAPGPCFGWNGPRSRGHAAEGGHMPGPLEGIVVVEAAQVISGPLAGMLLAQQGADVIKVEPPGHGDPTRLSGHRRAGASAIFANCNRAKRSVVLDATDPRGLELLIELVGRADVFTQNFRPGKAAKLGVGPEAMLARNPGLVYASIYGYGPDGPFAGRKVYDYVVQAAIGMADSQRSRPEGRPSLVRNYVIDKATSWATAQAVTAALLARERDPARRGQHVELSMLDVGVEFFWPDGMVDHTFLEDEGTEKVPLNLDFYDAYPTRDGAVAVYPVVPSFFAGLCDALGHPEWREDPRFADHANRRRTMAEFAPLVGEALAGFTTEEAVGRLVAADVAAAAVVPVHLATEHPQVRWNGSVVERVDPQLGRIQGPRHAPRFGAAPASPSPPLGDVPGLGQHTTEVLLGLGLSEAEVEALREEGVVGGPSATHKQSLGPLR